MIPEAIASWRYARALKPWRHWKRQTLRTLLALAPSEAPYQYDTALSFIQPDALDLAHPARVDLFFPDEQVLLLAVDVLGPDSRPHYRDAARYSTRSDWERRRAQIEYRSWILAEYRCPHLLITDDEATDTIALASRLKTLTLL